MRGPTWTSPSIRSRARTRSRKDERTRSRRIAVSEPGGLLHAPDTYMEKLVVGKPAAGKVDLDRPVAENLKIIAKSLNRDVDDLTVVVLDRPRHAELVAQVRAAGARIKLIEDGDLMAAISVAVRGYRRPRGYGHRRAPEGVLAAAALRCLGAEDPGRLKFRSNEERERAKRMGVIDDGRVYRTEDLASGRDVVSSRRASPMATFSRASASSPAARARTQCYGPPAGKLRFIDTTHFEDPANPPVVRL